MKKIIPYLVMIIGLGIIAYPKLKEVYEDYKSNQISSAIESGDYKPISITVGEEDENDNAPQAQNIIAQEEKPKAKGEKIIATPIGMLKIDKIGLKYPILEGSSSDILSIAVGHVKSTKKPGEDGNCALAAHRSFTYGRFFNRLDEVVVGDKVNIDTETNKFTYTIFEKKRVLPNDTSVLNSQKGKKYITLITCDPMKEPTHRLILVGKLN